LQLFVSAGVKQSRRYLRGFNLAIEEIVDWSKPILRL
jgi:hypothetical protein